MTTRKDEQGRAALLQGKPDLLILRTLLFDREHGQGISRAIQRRSGNELFVDCGSRHAALQRLESRAWIKAEWGAADNNRRARFYELTKAGPKQPATESQQRRG